FLLARKPDRLIIEPSGLGHAREVLNILSSEFYEKTVKLEATITLVNPAKLSDKRYLEHEIFRDQLTIADVLIANKTDLCSPEDKAVFQNQANTQDYLATDWVTGGQINPDYLSYPNRLAELKRHTEKMKDEKPPGAGHHPRLLNSPLLKNEPHAMPVAQFPESHTTEIQRSENSDGTFFSYGWVFPESTVLATRSIMDLLYRVQPLRAKGLLNTEEGFKVFQCSDGTVSVMSSDQGNDSRIEIIHDQALSAESLEIELLINSQLPASTN
ncbi:MAG: hypothetical protein MI864_27370, partial [Pseudomonadales bacterium]|nr:hypothetical protein [Pseudomonadales bacterium]